MNNTTPNNTRKLVAPRTSHLAQFFLLSFFLFLMLPPTLAQTWKDNYDKVYPTNDPIKVIVKKDNRWGLIDKQTGKVIIPLKYDYLDYKNRMVKVYQNNKVGVFTPEGGQLYPIKYEDAITPLNTNLVFLKTNGKWETKLNDVGEIEMPLHDAVKPLTLGHVALLKEGKWAIYNVHGKAVTSYQYDHINLESGNSPFCLVKMNDKKGLIKYDGTELIPPIYSQIEGQKKGAYLVEKENKWGLVNKINEIILPIEYDQINSSHYKYYKVKKEGKWAYVDKRNIETPIHFYEDIELLTTHVYRIKEGGKYGLIDMDYEPVTPCEYDKILATTNNLLIAQVNDKQIILDHAGKKIFDFDYDDCYLKFQVPFVFVKKGELYGLYRLDRHEVSPIQYDQILPIQYDQIVLFDMRHASQTFFKAKSEKGWQVVSGDGSIDSNSYDKISSIKSPSLSTYLFVVEKAGKAGVINLQKETVIPLIYDQIKAHHIKGSFLASKEGKWGIINTDNETLFPFEMDDIDKKAYVAPHYFSTEKGKNGIITYEGKELIPPIYDQIVILPEDVFKIKKGDKFGLADSKHQIIVPIQYEEIKYLKDNFYSLHLNNKFKLFKNGQPLLPTEYDHINRISLKTPIILTQQGDQYQIIDSAAQVIHTLNADSILPLPTSGYSAIEKRYLQVKNKQWGLIDMEGQEIYPAQFDTLIPYKSNKIFAQKNKKWGIIDLETKRTLIPFEYDSITKKLKVLKDDKWGLLDKELQVLIPPTYQHIKGSYSQKKIEVQKDNLWGLIHQKGQPLIPIIYEELKLLRADYFRIKKEGKYGIINTENDVITPTNYDNIFHISYASKFFPVEKEGKYGFVNPKLRKEVIPCIYDTLELQINRDTRMGKKQNKWGMVNMQGKEVIPFVFDTLLSPFNKSINEQTHFVAQKNNKFGIIRIDGTVTADFIYDKIQTSNKHINIAQKKDKYGLLDREGKEVTDIIYDEITYLERASSSETTLIFRVKKGKRYGFISNKGIEITPLKYREADVFVNNRAWVKEKKQFGAIDSEGKLIIPYQYDQVRRFQYDQYERKQHFRANWTTPFHPVYAVALVQKEDKWGMINNRGKVIIPCKYDTIVGHISIYDNTDNFYTYQKKLKKGQAPHPFETYLRYINRQGVVKVQNEGKYGVVNNKGEELIPLNYDQMSDLSQNIIWAFKNKQAYLYLPTGELTDSTLRKKYFQESILKPISINGYQGFINQQGKIIIPCQYEKAKLFNNGIGIVRQDGKWGAVDTTNTFVIPPIYDSLNSSSKHKDVFVAKKEGQFIFLNNQGEIVKIEEDK